MEWDVFKIIGSVWLCCIYAVSETEAIKKASVKFGVAEPGLYARSRIQGL